MQDWVQAAERYLLLLATALPLMGLLAVLGYGSLRLPAWHVSRVRSAWLGVAVAVGAALAWGRLALFDDAFISLRYAKNWLSGHGLVWNEGEPVLGITNVAWTVFVAILHQVTPLDLPHAALLAGAFAAVALLAATEGLARSLPGPPALPAAAAVAINVTFASYVSTGLETAAAAAAVVAGVLAALHAQTARRAAVAGLLFAVAALIRLDHGLFFAMALLLVPRRLWVPLLLFGVLVLAELAWAWWTYGDPLPNTFHAKVGGLRLHQGAIYAGTFWLGVHGLVLLPLAAVAVFRPASAADARLGRYVVAVFVLWHCYLLAIGGDFMFGRFLLVLLPFVWVLAERSLHSLGNAPAAGALFGIAAVNVVMIAPREMKWLLCDESTIYPVTQLFPLVVDHGSMDSGKHLDRWFARRGLRPVVATHGIGMVGYYADLEVVDTLGLTDRVVAHQRLDAVRTRRPGHEKKASDDYLRQRKVVLSRAPPDLAFNDVTKLRMGKVPNSPLGHWHLFRYDPVFVAELKAKVPEVGVTEIDGWLRIKRHVRNWFIATRHGWRSGAAPAATLRAAKGRVPAGFRFGRYTLERRLEHGESEIRKGCPKLRETQRHARSLIIATRHRWRSGAAPAATLRAAKGRVPAGFRFGRYALERRLERGESEIRKGCPKLRGTQVRQASRAPETAQPLLDFLDVWYFPDNPDPALRARLLSYTKAARAH